MKNTENKPPQILYVPLDLNNPKSEINGLFKEFAKALAVELIEELQSSKEGEVKLVSRSFAAKHLGVCEDSISSYEKRGLIKNYGAGRKKLYNLFELDNPQITRYKKVS